MTSFCCFSLFFFFMFCSLIPTLKNRSFYTKFETVNLKIAAVEVMLDL